MTFQEELRQGIPAELPEMPPYDTTINHAPKRKDILTPDEKRLALRNALRNHAVVGAEDEERSRLERDVGAAGESGDLSDRVLQQTEAAQRLCKRIPARPGCRSGGITRRRNMKMQFVYHGRHVLTKRSASGVSPPSGRWGKPA